ncbi:hypothetical protein JTE90_013378 [Oedothorax gibbosus]|nr:hypothetical protein JTE90_013378 [Oedothorax gibbosus]
MRETLDKVFDTDIFSKTHDHYEAARIYIPDDFYELYWDGQLGGIEGLNQDTWMITYLGQIKYAFKGVCDSFHLLAKGDDLRAAVPIPVAISSSTLPQDQPHPHPS